MNKVKDYLEQAKEILGEKTITSDVIEVAKMLQVESAFDLQMKMHEAPKDEKTLS